MRPAQLPLVVKRAVLGALGALAALGALGATGCGAPARPYRFASPLIGGVALPRATSPARPDRPGRADRPARPRRDRLVDPATGQALAAVLLPRRPQRAPHHDGAGPQRWVGVRDGADPQRAVLARCRARNPACPAELPPRERWQAPSLAPIAPGDLLVFDRVAAEPHDVLVALVESRDARGVFEISYLAAGVWRRGFVDPLRPRLRRDQRGQVVNTFLRHHRARPPAGTRFLAGELLVGVVPVRAPPAEARDAQLSAQLR